MKKQKPLKDVMIEIAKQFEADLDGREVLLLVFASKRTRREFIELVKLAKPGMCEFHY